MWGPNSKALMWWCKKDNLFGICMGLPSSWCLEGWEGCHPLHLHELRAAPIPTPDTSKLINQGFFLPQKKCQSNLSREVVWLWAAFMGHQGVRAYSIRWGVYGVGKEGFGRAFDAVMLTTTIDRNATGPAPLVVRLMAARQAVLVGFPNEISTLISWKP